MSAPSTPPSATFAGIELPHVEQVTITKRAPARELGADGEEVTILDIAVTCGPGQHGNPAKHYTDGDLVVDAPNADGVRVRETFEQAKFRDCVRRHHKEDHGAVYCFLTSYRAEGFAS